MVLDGSVDYGVLPVENSLTGSIHRNYDLLMQYPDVRIVGEITIRIRWCLIAPPGSSTARIRRVLSHPQGLAQCARFLAGFPDWEKVPFYDTAGAVAEVARTGEVTEAALAGTAAAREHGMEILAEGVETDVQNYTRFVALARDDAATVPDPTRASIVFSARDEPGSLFNVLQVLADNNLNMKKLESRPIPGSPWEYMFYVDLDVPAERKLFDRAMEQVQAAAASYRLLGMYSSNQGR